MPEVENSPLSAADKRAVAVLLLLYTIQGIPMGLSASVPFLLQSQTKASYSDQAIFAFCTWPFSLKLLWAPLVDSVYFSSFGRRKSWLVPVQAAAGMAMVYLGSQVDGLLGDSDGEPQMWTLTAWFFGVYLLMATQDIAVDGWALTMLSKDNVELGSTCNTIGQQFGYFLSFVGFLALNDAGTCNKYFRPTLGYAEGTEGIVSLGGFLIAFGWLTLATTMIVALLQPEKADDTTHPIGKAYLELAQAARSDRALQIFSILLTYRVAFAVPDHLTHLKMVEYGFKKEDIAIVTPLLLPVGLLVPVVARYFSWHPLKVWLTAFPIRLTVGVVDMWIIYQAPRDSVLAFRAFVALSIVWTIVSTVMFSAQMEFFSTEAVGNPALGASFMTLLNTIANLGGSWPQPTVLWLVDKFTIKTIPCDKEMAYECIVRDGVYPLAVAGTVVGILWLVLFGPVVKRMADTDRKPKTE
eukprot:m.85399 g.85399  ORF g.85399 m.85399 type:complete len:467 (-) comp11381_c0_seq1:248-1648(-)